MKPKTWRAGVADEPWKVAVCHSEIDLAKNVLSGLTYILGAGPENFTGAEIKQAIEAYASSGRKSIAAGEKNDRP